MTEEKYIDSLISMLRKNMENDYLKGTTKRDAHPKTLGLLKAEFKVVKDLPEFLRVGLFKEAKSYNSFIRISSSSPKVEGDDKKDARGFAIKLINVQGAKVLKDEKNTQDFILLSNEVFPFSSLKAFHDLVYARDKGKLPCYVVKTILKGDLPNLIKLAVIPKNQTSPFDISYFSTTAYKFGGNVVRYCIVPRNHQMSKMPKDMTASYLSNNMQKQLDEEKIIFDFKVQIQKEGMKDDPSIIWSKRKSPYIKVAEIIIDKQNVMDKKRNDLAELLSFNVGHSLIEHTPIGEFNRARMKIYTELSKFRHLRNGEKLLEPTNSDFNLI
ncbi:hypothetical protein [uncultured Clostridium sp.]|uniref:hypothetical protein n=1 Tax=uncultured Clostridium sp. TaxID=59620 RepID=UPI0026133302|nr:hypothetical protein [uncultured Clostridium sp.]